MSFLSIFYLCRDRDHLDLHPYPPFPRTTRFRARGSCRGSLRDSRPVSSPYMIDEGGMSGRLMVRLPATVSISGGASFIGAILMVSVTVPGLPCSMTAAEIGRAHV